MTTPENITAAGLTIRASQTTPTRPGKAPRPVWIVDGITGPYETLLRELGGHRWRGTWSFWTDPTDEIARALETATPASYAARMQAKQDRAAERADRYTSYAASAERRAEQAHTTARTLLDPIPLGQPILIGHHSERRHRRALDRADRAMRRAVDASETARYHEHRAEAASRTAAGQHSPGFAQRRIEEAEATIRDCDRRLAALDVSQATYRARVDAWKHEAEGKRDYWREQLQQAGGIQHTRDTIRPGDEVLTRHGWARVRRTNPKTVAVEWTTGPLAGMDAKYPYAELRGHRQPGQENAI